jgi:hypothetical protein
MDNGDLIIVDISGLVSVDDVAEHISKAINGLKVTVSLLSLFSV